MVLGCDSNLTLVECPNLVYGSDRISELPDETVPQIMSKLSIIECGQLAVLSRRWRNLWRRWNPNLDFSFAKLTNIKPYLLPYLGDNKIKFQQRRYVNWVNSIIESQKYNPRVNEFIICCVLNSDFGDDINKWIFFAMDKDVQVFELSCVNVWENNFIFPSLHLPEATPQPNNGFRFLKDLRISSVAISGEVVEFLLSNSLSLESLAILYSQILVNLRISGDPTLKLKRLTILFCYKLQQLDINAHNLVSFRYDGHYTGVPFKETPMLSQLSLDNNYCEHFILNPTLHSSYIPQIEKLTFSLCEKSSDCLTDEIYKMLPSQEFPVRLSSLKELELRISVTQRERYFFFSFIVPIIKASPVLSTFKLYLSHIFPEFNSTPEEELKSFVLTKIIPQNFSRPAGTKFSHQFLKTVTYNGFAGYQGDFNLALHLIQISPSLEEMVVTVDGPFNKDNDKSKYKTMVKENVSNLQEFLPHAVKFSVY